MSYRDGQEVKSTGCSSTGKGLDSQHPQENLQPSVTVLRTLSQGSPYLFLASMGTRLTCDADIHVGKTKPREARQWGHTP